MLVWLLRCRVTNPSGEPTHPTHPPTRHSHLDQNKSTLHLTKPDRTNGRLHAQCNSLARRHRPSNRTHDRPSNRPHGPAWHRHRDRDGVARDRGGRDANRPAGRDVGKDASRAGEGYAGGRVVLSSEQGAVDAFLSRECDSFPRRRLWQPRQPRCDSSPHPPGRPSTHPPTTYPPTTHPLTRQPPLSSKRFLDVGQVETATPTATASRTRSATARSPRSSFPTSTAAWWRGRSRRRCEGTSTSCHDRLPSTRTPLPWRSSTGRSFVRPPSSRPTSCASTGRRCTATCRVTR